jgi:hypothetical protein
MSITAKSIILDIADGWGAASLGLRSVEFYLSDVLVETANTGDATSSYNYINYDPTFAFDTSLAKIGSVDGTSWVSASGASTNQRLLVYFSTTIEFDKVVINNLHNSGDLTTWGAKNVVITATPDLYTSTVYNASIPSGTVLFEGILDEHVADNVEDPQTVYVAPTTVGVFIAPLVSVAGEGDVTAAGSTEVISPLVSLTSIGDVKIMGAGHIVTPGVRVHGDYGALGNVEVSATVDSYGKVSIIGNGDVNVLPATVGSIGQLSLLATTSYVVKLPVVTSAGIVYPTGYGALSVSPPSVMGYGYITSFGSVDVVVKLPQIVCPAKQADDYTVIRHTREGICR